MPKRYKTRKHKKVTRPTPMLVKIKPYKASIINDKLELLQAICRIGVKKAIEENE